MQPDPMDHLADALVEDILATPPEVLLAESAEDYGDPRALAAEFDRIVTSNASPVGAVTLPHVPAGGVSQRAADPSRWRVGFERLWQTLLAAGDGRLTPWGAPIAAVCLLALVALSVMAALHWERRGSSEEFMHGLTPASTRPAAGPADGLSGRGVEYLVLFPEQPSLEAALASYRNLQGRLPGLLAGRDPVIRAGVAGDHAYVAGIGPFTKADEAKDFCSELTRTGAACHVGEADR
jgi:hypothetical protein